MVEKQEPFFLEGFAVEAAIVRNFKDKRFTILDREYRETPRLDNPEESERKLVLAVELVENKQRQDYFPNKTSQKALAKMFGPDVNAWIGKMAEWEVAKQSVAGNMRDVLFVVEK